MRQVVQVGHHVALVARVLVEDVDALADNVIPGDAGRQQLGQFVQGVDRVLVGKRDLEGLRITGHDIGRQEIEHPLQPLALGDHTPVEHHRPPAAIQVLDDIYVEIEYLVADPDQGLVGEDIGLGEQAALEGRILVKNVDTLADDVVGIDARRQQVGDLTRVFRLASLT